MQERQWQAMIESCDDLRIKVSAYLLFDDSYCLQYRHFVAVPGVSFFIIFPTKAFFPRIPVTEKNIQLSLLSAEKLVALEKN